MAPSEQCHDGRCEEHYHSDDASAHEKNGNHPEATTPPSQPAAIQLSPDDRGFRRIVRNFTPSWFMVTMSTGVLALVFKAIPPPYDAHWLRIVADIFFVLNIGIFLLFVFITTIRYVLYPELLQRVVRHPHQSLFLATAPVGLATIINMIALVCAPAWGQGWAIFAWVLWWIDCLLALGTCFHLSFTVMTNRRKDFSDMTALYLIPVVAVVIMASTGATLANAISDRQHQLWTLYISYVLWAIGSPLSWIIFTLYFLRLTIHKPLKREVIVSLLIPIGPLGIEGFSIISLGRNAQRLFTETHAFPHTVPDAGGIIHTVSVLVGLLLWGFAILWIVVAVMMLAVSGGFPFNTGWWGFIFPFGVFTLLTITIGTSLESRFFKILSLVLTAGLVIMWFIVAAGTIQRAITGEIFFSPCLGTNLYGNKLFTNATDGPHHDGLAAKKQDSNSNANPSEMTVVAGANSRGEQQHV